MKSTEEGGSIKIIHNDISVGTVRTYIQDTLFENNKAVRGGAIYSQGATIEIELCIFKNNWAQS
jgi:predicted outer membrane repeat protein